MTLTFLQIMLVLTTYGAVCLVVYFKYVQPKMNEPFKRLDEQNKQMKELTAYIDGFESPMEKLEKGMIYLLGADWFKGEYVEQNPMQHSLTSNLLVYVLYHSSNQSKNEVKV